MLNESANPNALTENDRDAMAKQIKEDIQIVRKALDQLPHDVVDQNNLLAKAAQASHVAHQIEKVLEVVKRTKSLMDAGYDLPAAATGAAVGMVTENVGKEACEMMTHAPLFTGHNPTSDDVDGLVNLMYDFQNACLKTVDDKSQQAANIVAKTVQTISDYAGNQNNYAVIYGETFGERFQPVPSPEYNQPVKSTISSTKLANKDKGQAEFVQQIWNDIQTSKAAEQTTKTIIDALNNNQRQSTQNAIPATSHKPSNGQPVNHSSANPCGANLACRTAPMATNNAAKNNNSTGARLAQQSLLAANRATVAARSAQIRNAGSNRPGSRR